MHDIMYIVLSIHHLIYSRLSHILNMMIHVLF